MELEKILEECGFRPYTIIKEELSEEYLNKWSRKDMGLEAYIKRGKIIAFKPVK